MGTQTQKLVVERNMDEPKPKLQPVPVGGAWRVEISGGQRPGPQLGVLHLHTQ